MDDPEQHEVPHEHHHYRTRIVRLPPDELDQLAHLVREKLKAEFALKGLVIIGANFVVGVLAIFTAAGTWYSLSSRVDANTAINEKQETVFVQRAAEQQSLKTYIDIRFDTLRQVLDARDATLNNKIDEINRFLRDHNNSSVPPKR